MKNESPQIIFTYRVVQYDSCVTKFHERSYSTIDLHRIAANTTRVYRAAIPLSWKKQI